jgi:hypothetical protein
MHLFKSAAHFLNKPNAKDSSDLRLKQFAKTPNAATSPQKVNSEPPGKHGTSVRDIGGKAGEVAKAVDYKWL